MTATAAVLYKKDGYDTKGNRLLGRQAAGEGFLKGLVQHGTADCLYCYAANRTEYIDFCQLIQPWITGTRQVKWLPSNDPKVLAQPGAIFRPDPGISELAWQRRFLDQRAYSLCGVTHTIASKGVMQNIGDLLIAPVQPWDALICTSAAVKSAMARLLDTWAEYLAQRTGGRPNIEVQLPIIPLGVDCDAIAQGEEAQTNRSRLRQALGIGQDDIVVLFLGRLIFYAKAHPVPLYIALEKAAQLTNAKVHLVQAGWFDDQKEEAPFINSAKTFCPSVNTIFVDGRKPEIRSGIWSVADMFISLADNVQETFGLTPIEAMAAGLPVIVSDWDGYQESVRHEIDGFKIPTILPPPGCGLDLSFSYLSDELNYSSYIGHTSMMTAVDTDACAEALAKLITDGELRQRMGENGRQRAREMYDWKVAIAAYENLWQQLAEIRATAPMSASLTPGMPPYPLCDDPFRLYAHYPTTTLTKDLVLSLGAMATPERWSEIQTIWITNFGTDRRMPLDTINRILVAIQQAGSLSVEAIVKQFASQNPTELAYLLRTLGYLLKFDILRVER
jgi:starch synthase